MNFTGSIVITDPVYYLSEGDWEATEYGKNLDVAGFSTFLFVEHADCVGQTVMNDKDEEIGCFCDDAGVISVVLLDELLEYSPDFLESLEEHCYTIIEDFSGEVFLEECGDDEYSIRGEGSLNFHTCFDEE